MKFRGFKSNSLNFGDVDIQVVASTGVFGNFSCLMCDFTSPQMRYFNCGHVACESCLRTHGSWKSVDLNASGPSVLETESDCISCQSATSSIAIELSEAFVTCLLCICSRCSLKIRLNDLEEHLRTCEVKQISVPDEQLDCDGNHRLVSSTLLNKPLRCGFDELLSIQNNLTGMVRQQKADLVDSVDSLKECIGLLRQSVLLQREVVTQSCSKSGMGEYRVTLSNKILTEKSLIYVSSTMANIGGTLFYFVLSDGHLCMVVKQTVHGRRLKGRVTALGYTCPCPRNLNEIAADTWGVPAVGASLTIGYCDMTKIRHSFRLWVQLDNTC